MLKAQQELELQFTRHGFKVADDAAVTKALTEAKFDLTDEDNQRKPVFY